MNRDSASPSAETRGLVACLIAKDDPLRGFGLSSCLFLALSCGLLAVFSWSPAGAFGDFLVVSCAPRCGLLLVSRCSLGDLMWCPASGLSLFEVYSGMISVIIIAILTVVITLTLTPTRRQKRSPKLLALAVQVPSPNLSMHEDLDTKGAWGICISSFEAVQPRPSKHKAWNLLSSKPYTQQN